MVVDSSAAGKIPGEGEETQVPQRGYYNRTEAETIVEMVAQLSNTMFTWDKGFSDWDKCSL